MLFIKLLTLMLLGFFLRISIIAQENTSENVTDHSMMQDQAMQMMEHAKSDTDNMMQMCKMMMDNPEMHKTMMEKMHSDGMMKHNMMNDSTKTMDRSEHESHQQKKY